MGLFVLPAKLSNDTVGVQRALLQGTIDEVAPGIGPVRVGEEEVPLALLKRVHVFSSKVGGHEVGAALRVRVSVPVVEDLSEEPGSVNDA